jgi:hypothetical protein
VTDRDSFTARVRELDKPPDSSSPAIEHGESTGARQAAENAPSIVPSHIRRKTHSGNIADRQLRRTRGNVKATSKF